MADRVAVMIGGRILQIASPTDLYNDPHHLDVSTFVGSPRINLLPALVDEAGFARFGGAPLAEGFEPNVGQTITLGVRPEHITLLTEPQEGALPALLLRVEFLGADKLAHFLLDGFSEPIVARVAPQVIANLHTGDRVFVAPSRAKVVAFDENGARIQRRVARLSDFDCGIS